MMPTARTPKEKAICRRVAEVVDRLAEHYVEAPIRITRNMICDDMPVDAAVRALEAQRAELKDLLTFLVDRAMWPDAA